MWEGARALWEHGGGACVAAVAVFAAGTTLAFGLEALVAGVQALRLEYYELFSRVFVTQGRHLGESQSGLHGGEEESVIATSQPSRRIRRRQ